jgi:hypothetical protein
MSLSSDFLNLLFNAVFDLGQFCLFLLEQVPAAFIQSLELGCCTFLAGKVALKALLLSLHLS